jgi:hypothetical protein
VCNRHFVVCCCSLPGVGSPPLTEPPTPSGGALPLDARLAMAALQFARFVPSVAHEFGPLLQALRVVLRLTDGGSEVGPGVSALSRPAVVGIFIVGYKPAHPRMKGCPKP